LLVLLDRLRHELDLTLVVATHDPAVAAVADRVVRLVDGRVTDDRMVDGDATLGVHALD
jgi:putative ABC transport system ATP-binding protein